MQQKKQAQDSPTAGPALVYKDGAIRLEHSTWVKGDAVGAEGGTSSEMEETVLAADTGTITFREYDHTDVHLGLHDGNCPDLPPQLTIKLTHRQQVNLARLLTDNLLRRKLEE